MSYSRRPTDWDENEKTVTFSAGSSVRWWQISDEDWAMMSPIERLLFLMAMPRPLEKGMLLAEFTAPVVLGAGTSVTITTTIT